MTRQCSNCGKSIETDCTEEQCPNYYCSDECEKSSEILDGISIYNQQRSEKEKQMTVTNEALLNSLLADVVKLRNEYGYAYNKLETALCHYDEVNVKMTIRLTREKLDEIIKRHMQQQETPDNERYEHEKN